jgi:hypothetical protein
VSGRADRMEELVERLVGLIAVSAVECSRFY